MKLTRLSAPARLLTVALLMVAWLVATNHCAFGLMKLAGAGATLHAHCHRGSDAPGKAAPAGGVRECCKSIVGAPVPEQVEVKAGAATWDDWIFALCEWRAPARDDRALALAIYDHGPPPAVSFAEAVLQRSLLSHAPPLAV